MRKVGESGSLGMARIVALVKRFDPTSAIDMMTVVVARACAMGARGSCFQRQGTVWPQALEEQESSKEDEEDNDV